MSEQLEIVPVKELPVAVTQSPSPEKTTAAQAKVDAIASLTLSAYQRAATLEITPEESAKLQADFPDEAFQTGAAGKENLLYLEHAHLRDRFNEVFGMGKWAIVPRNRWAESFTTAKGTPGERVYVEAMLVVRGCFVGEAVGAMEYYPKNESQNYGDAVEGAKTAAFRRCAKEFGVGLQAWKKEWCEQWWKRKRGVKPSQSVSTPPKTPEPAKSPSKAATGTPAAAKTSDLLPKEATEATRTWFLEQLVDYESAAVLAYMREINWLLPTETFSDLPLKWVPTSKEALRAWMLKFEQWRDGDIAPEPPDEAWRAFPMPYGKNAGTPLEDLEKNYLYGLWANMTVETEYNGKPKKPETIAKDMLFREMLDAAGTYYEFTKKD